MSKRQTNRDKTLYILKFSASFSICVGVGWTIGAASKRQTSEVLLGFLSAWGISTIFLITIGLICDRILRSLTEKNQLPYQNLQIVKPFGSKQRKLKFEYEFSDYLQANRFHLYRQLGYWYGLIVVGLFDICIGILVYLRPSDTVLWLLLIFFLAFPLYSHLSLPIRARKLFKRQKQLHGLLEFELKSNQLSSKNPVTQQIHKWFLKAEFNDKFILLFNTPATFIILPRRVFLDDQQYKNWIAEVLKLVSEP